jgi:hypothetical protein
MLLTSEFQPNSQDPITHRPDMLMQEALRIKPYAKSEIGHLTNLPRKDGKVRVAGHFPSNPDTIIFADKLFSVDSRVKTDDHREASTDGVSGLFVIF